MKGASRRVPTAPGWRDPRKVVSWPSTSSSLLDSPWFRRIGPGRIATAHDDFGAFCDVNLVFVGIRKIFLFYKKKPTCNYQSEIWMFYTTCILPEFSYFRLSKVKVPGGGEYYNIILVNFLFCSSATLKTCRIIGQCVVFKFIASTSMHASPFGQYQSTHDRGNSPAIYLEKKKEIDQCLRGNGNEVRFAWRPTRGMGV